MTGATDDPDDVCRVGCGWGAAGASGSLGEKDTKKQQIFSKDVHSDWLLAGYVQGEASSRCHCLIFLFAQGIIHLGHVLAVL